MKDKKLFKLRAFKVNTEDGIKALNLLDDVMAADEAFSKLMGEEVEPRREFIAENAVYVKNLDY